MKKVWIDNYVCNQFAEEVADVLGRDDFNVELFGVSLYDKKLPKNCHIVDYGSRETLAVIENGEVIDDPEEVNDWVDRNCTCE